MKYEDAIKEAIKGNKVKYNDAIIYMEEGWLIMKFKGKITQLLSDAMMENNNWEIVEDIITANIEPSSDMYFHCLKCDTAPIDVEKDKDGFYICKECKEIASVVDKDKQEKF